MVAGANDLLSLINTDDFQGVVQVSYGDLLDLQNVIRVENGLEVLSRQKLRLELVQAVVVGVLLVKLLALD